MDKDTVDGILRMIAAAVSGYLVAGWRGAIVAFLTLWVVAGLLRDLCEVAAKLTKYAKTNL